MRTKSRELLAVGIFGNKSKVGDRIEMLLRRGRTFSPGASSVGVAASAFVLGALTLAGSLAPRWIAFAQQQPSLAFEVASVKQSQSSDMPNSNIPLGPGDVYISNGGRFSATNFPLITYISFAYKLQGNQFQSFLSQMPGWAKTDRYNIEARAEGNLTKDQMRLMMRSLLADRFKLVTHNETRQVPVLGLVLLKAGKTGPQLQPYTLNASCSSTLAAPPAGPLPTVAGGFPVACGGIFGMPPSAPGRVHAGARNVTMALIANFLAGMGNLGRPVVDRTDLSGTFNFSLEWTPEPTSPVPQAADVQPDTSGPTFLEAIKEQLGFKLEPGKGPVDTIVVDHVERPSEN